MSLRTRLLLALLTLVAAGLLVAGGVTYVSLRDFLLERVDEQALDGRVAVTVGLERLLQNGSSEFGFGGPGLNLPIGTYTQLRGSDGSVLIAAPVQLGGQSTDYAQPVLPSQLPSAGRQGTSTFFTVTKSTGGEATAFRVLVASAPDVQGTVVVAIPLADMQQTLARLMTLEVIVSLIVLAALATAAWLIVKRDLRPLEKMAVTADAISGGDLSRRVEPAEPRTEVGRLGLSLNTMLARIEEAFEERTATEEKLRRFLADASHELRTPLTSIRGYSEVFKRAKDDPEDLDLAMRRIQEESQRMGVMVEELLVLARLGEGREPEKLPVDLARVVDDCVCDARATAPGRDIKLDRVETADVLGDDHQLHQVVHNLLRNAVRHTPDDAEIRVQLRHDHSYATLVVADDGPGLEPDVAAKVFEPFYRADKSRARQTGGAGLGLAIVAAIVEAHHGTVRLDTTPGAGATFTVTLPLIATAES